jgi:hypothetical protein
MGIGETPSGRTVLILLDNLHTRAIINDGQLLHDLILDYQPEAFDQANDPAQS